MLKLDKRLWTIHKLHHDNELKLNDKTIIQERMAMRITISITDHKEQIIRLGPE